MHAKMEYHKFKQIIFSVVFCQLGFLVTYGFYSFGLHPIMASSATGILASFMPKANLYNVEDAKGCVYCASFAAIGTHLNYNSPFEFIVLPLFVGILFNLLRPYFVGFGGKLGSLAFVATTFYLLLKEIF